MHKSLTVTLGSLIALCLLPAATAAQQQNEQSKTKPLVAEYSEGFGEPKTLAETLDFASKNAPEVLRAKARIGLGDAAVEGAKRFQPFNPEVEGEVGVGLDEPGLERVEFMLLQRVEVAGERGLRVDSAQKQRQALRAELREAEWSVHEKVHRLYRVGLVGQRRVATERQILQFTQEVFDVASERYEAGEEPRTSVIVARAEVAKARQRLLGAWTSYMRTLRQLSATVGWDEAAPPKPTGELEATRAVPDIGALLEKAYENDPKLAVFRARLEQARAELALAEREVWPSPLFGLGFEREEMGTQFATSKVLFAVGVPLPLWNRNQGEIATANARADILRQAIDSRKQVLASRVREKAESVDAAYRQSQIFEEEVLPAVESQLELLQEGFSLGEMSLLDVMNARDRLLEVQRQRLDALGRYFVAVSELEQFIGTSIWD